jgi:hypothetical protein
MDIGLRRDDWLILRFPDAQGNSRQRSTMIGFRKLWGRADFVGGSAMERKRNVEINMMFCGKERIWYGLAICISILLLVV